MGFPLTFPFTLWAPAQPSFISSSVVAEERVPTAVHVANPPYGVIGSVIQLDGRQSSDPDGHPLTYQWSFISVPIGSGVAIEGFKVVINELEENDPTERDVVVSFSPDVVGEYIIGLVVSNDLYSSPMTTIRISIRAILVPHGRGLVPDGKFIYSYIRDVWSQVDGKEWFETFWSALIQIAGSELIKLYQVDYNKSIRDIQDLFQRRWLKYEPQLVLTTSDLSFYFCEHFAGTNGSSVALTTGLAVMLSATEMVVVVGSVLPNVAGDPFTIIFDDKDPSNEQTYTIGGLNPSKTGYRLTPSLTPNPGPDKIESAIAINFAFQSTTWTLPASSSHSYAMAYTESESSIDDYTDILFGRSGATPANLIKVGDVFHFPSGPNAGFYRILTKSGSSFVVDHAPPSFSDATTSLNFRVDVYRPVSFKIAEPDQVVTNTLAIPFDPAADVSQVAPGRVIIFGGQCYKIVRSVVDESLSPPMVIITTDGQILTGLTNVNWRTPPTLISASQNFEQLGVTNGDLIQVDVSNKGTNTIASVVAQVVGVTGSAIGFVMTDQPVQAGVIPPIPNKTFLALSTAFGILTVSQNQDGTLTFSGDARAILNFINSGLFSKLYCNVELTPNTVFNILGGAFQLLPKIIIRNTKIPVDTSLKSVPILQNWIVQPSTVSSGGKVFQVKDGIQYDITGNAPLSLVENSDFIIDDEFAFIGQMTFETGTNIIFVQNGDFIDRGLVPGDTFTILSPITLAGTYYISAIISPQEIELSRPVPLYVLNSVVTADVEIQRSSVGSFLRFIPGAFTAANPAPPRFWAEVSFFDNGQNIEDNFGILVGLTRADLDAVSASINYRQAVAGLMYAYTQGSAVEKIRIGAQILLGLPFAENAGIIRAIDTNYRLDINGNPVQGRILIEDIDSTGIPQGTQRIYLFPLDPNNPFDDLAGVDTNPVTNLPYVVGDTVQLFAPLSKGVEILDYLVQALGGGATAVAQIQKYQSFTMRASDTLFTQKELSLVSSFLSKITPAYVAFIMQSAAEFVDDVIITDALIPKLVIGGPGGDPLVDNASLEIPTPLKFDEKDIAGVQAIQYGNGVYWVRHFGRDLSTNFGSSVCTSASGGILNPNAGEGPVTRVGDSLLIIGGLNNGLYQISSATDTTATVTGFPSVGPQTETNQIFAILRPITAVIRTGSSVAINSANTLTVDVGLTADGVSPNDKLYLIRGTTFAKGFRIVGVGPNTALGLVAGQVQVIPNIGATPPPGTLTYAIIRESLMESPFIEYTGNLVSSGSAYTSLTSIVEALTDIGDELQVQDATGLRLQVFDPVNLGIAPVLAAGTYTVAVCKRRHRSSTPIGWNHIEFFDPFDTIDVALIDPDAAEATCTSGSPNVSLVVDSVAFNPVTGLVRPGDKLKLPNGGNSSVDVGYGPGIYPIVQVTSAHVVLGVNLTSNNPSSWQIIRSR